jgi:hypothetical protein
MVLAFYVLPGEHLEIQEIQPGVRVAEEAGCPVGASRPVSWGERTILVVRSGERTYAALQHLDAGFECAMYHDQAPAMATSELQCDACHELHHPPEASCMSCHRDRAKPKHALAFAHSECTQCHGNKAAGITRVGTIGVHCVSYGQGRTQRPGGVPLMS